MKLDEITDRQLIMLLIGLDQISDLFHNDYRINRQIEDQFMALWNQIVEELDSREIDELFSQMYEMSI